VRALVGLADVSNADAAQALGKEAAEALADCGGAEARPYEAALVLLLQVGHTLAALSRAGGA
jgi:hypothetical protein